MIFLCLNLAARLSLFTWTMVSGHWHGGDTDHFTYYAYHALQGQWGGEPNRVPLYLWFLGLFSPGLKYPNPTSLMLAVPLLVQTLLVWGSGFWLWKRGKGPARWAALVWLWDPALFVYSHLVVADSLFAVLVLFAGYHTYFALMPNQHELKDDATWQRQGAYIGLFYGLLLMMRPVAVTLAWWSLAALVVSIFLSKGPARPRAAYRAGLALLIAFLIISPRLYWNYKQSGKVALALQGSAWLMSVAGVVENQGLGMDYPNAERKWFSEHRSELTTWGAMRTLFRHWKAWAYLSLKGSARILFGHVNVEWSYLALGEAPIGPGWFRTPEQRAGPRVAGVLVLPWILGLLTTAIFSAYVYVRTFRMVWKFRRRQAVGKLKREWDGWWVWALGALAILTITPQVYGDARFRLALWPILILLVAFTDEKFIRRSQNT